ncbi:MAG: HEPN domain-containing protein [Patescibacteria group bacterium]|nr:HEPN domain-containing protein [Patescibacteria group bacterium]
MDNITERKKYVIQLLKDIEKHPATGDYKLEMMSFSYIMVCGAIEYMIENILHDWLNKTIKHHKYALYRGKKYVQYFLETQMQAREKNIEYFNSTKLDKIRKLICDVAGKGAKINFNKLFNNSRQSMTLQPDINARLDRINRIRHELAHGQKIPSDIQPNISELKEDFIFVYNHIIKNIKKCLPRVLK